MLIERHTLVGFCGIASNDFANKFLSILKFWQCQLGLYTYMGLETWRCSIVDLMLFLNRSCSDLDFL